MELHEDIVPSWVGPFRVLRRLGSGLTSDALLARAEGPAGFERLVVLKRFLQQNDASAALQPLFMEEASRYARLNHPNVVKLFEFFTTETHFVLVQEYVDGVALNALRASLNTVGVALGDDSSIYIAACIFSALLAAHGVRDPQTNEITPVLHRDINPANVLVTWDGHVKLAEWAIGKHHMVETESRAGFIKGTFGYLSPEQVRGDRVTIRADVYAATVVLWELLARRKAIQRGALPESEVLRIMAEPKIIPLDVLRPDLPAQLREAVARGIHANPDRRSITAEEMYGILRVTRNMDDARAKLVDLLARVRPQQPTPAPEGAWDSNMPLAPSSDKMETAVKIEAPSEASHNGGFAASVPFDGSQLLPPPNPPPNPGTARESPMRTLTPFSGVPSPRGRRPSFASLTGPLPVADATQTGHSFPKVPEGSHGGNGTAAGPPSGSSITASGTATGTGTGRSPLPAPPVAERPQHRPPPVPVALRPLSDPLPVDEDLAATLPVPPADVRPSTVPPPRVSAQVGAPPAPSPFSRTGSLVIPPEVLEGRASRPSIVPFDAAATRQLDTVVTAGRQARSRGVKLGIVVALLSCVVASALGAALLHRGQWRNLRFVRRAPPVAPAVPSRAQEPVPSEERAAIPSAETAPAVAPSLQRAPHETPSASASGQAPAASVTVVAPKPSSVPTTVASAPPQGLPVTKEPAPQVASQATTGTVLPPPSARGHRVFIDGKVIGSGTAAITVSCGPHRVQVGSAGKPQSVFVPCGGELKVEGH